MINGNNFNSLHHTPKILVTPLDWGLGHATRCIPIINELIYHHCEVIIAASGEGFFLLKKEFPALVILRINTYKISYSRRRSLLLLKLVAQVPAMAISIWKEKLWLDKIIKKYKIDAVISDNRPGMNSKKITSVYITHQLLIKTGNIFFEKIAQKIHYHLIKQFTYCWVPDYKENGLAGELSHQENSPSNVLYIGPLSRFELLTDMPNKYDVLVSISGPEPQRTIFEKKIFSQLKNYNKKVLFVRGLPTEHESLKTENELIQILNHLPADELNKAFQESKIVISRSGYTTIMDLIKLGKNAVLVPTPGQTEQEYLSNYLMKKNIFYSVTQDRFSLDKINNYTSAMQPVKMAQGMDNYKQVISDFLVALNTGNFQTQ
ncbi:MAG TPA: glycosyltransferase [Ginsengibacter sp.]|nr:glycosyltransferase [Ginsengibacter sp.]